MFRIFATTARHKAVAPWLVEAPECRGPPGKVLTRTLSCPDIAALVADGPFGPAGLQSRLPAVPRPLLAPAARCTPPTSPEKSGKELTVWQPAVLPSGVAALAGAPTPTPSPPRRHEQGEAMEML